MNKAELIERLIPEAGGRRQATRVVDRLLDIIIREVAAGRRVSISGFGAFERAQRAPRTGRNPRTGEPVPIESRNRPTFRPGLYFRDAVLDPTTLPVETRTANASAPEHSSEQPPGSPGPSRAS